MPRSKGHDINAHRTQEGRLRHQERLYTESETKTNVEEVWFAGCHCDIGGGSVKNGTRNSLARIPLRWMIRQCFLADTGIMFHKDTLLKVGLDPDTLCTKLHLPRPPMIFQDPKVHTIPVPEPAVLDDDRKAVVYTDGDSFLNEEEEDFADALCPMYDQLKLAKFWWILEWCPMKIQYQDSNTNKIVRKLTMNKGRARHVAMQRKKGIKVHRTVQIREKAEGIKGVKGKYAPEVEFRVEPTYVD